jgi:hypothetical protein
MKKKFINGMVESMLASTKNGEPSIDILEDAVVR